MPQGTRCRRKSPVKPPFVPPPARTSRVLPSSSGYEDEHRLRSQMSNYEKKVDSLLNEMGSLRNDAELQRTKRDLEKHELIRERESALQELASLENNGMPPDSLIRKLLETEIDADQLAMRAQTLEDQIARVLSVTHGRALNAADCAAISDAGGALRCRLSALQTGLRALRGTLRERERAEMTNTSLTDQRDALLRKLADADADCARLREEAAAHKSETEELRALVARERDAHANASRERAELEARLNDSVRRAREMESECTRLADRARVTDCATEQRTSDAERARRDSDEQRERAEREREVANKAIAKLRERLTRAEDALERAKREASEKEARAAELGVTNDQMTRNADKVSREKTEAVGLVTQLRTRIELLETELRARGDSTRKELDVLNERLRERSNEVSSLRAENERMRVPLAVSEQKMRQLENDYERACSAAKMDEKQREDFRVQAQRALRDKEDLEARLEDSQRQVLRMQKQAETDLEQLRLRFQQRVQELESLPEMLKTSELSAQEAREREQLAERRALEHSRALADLTSKFESAVEREAETRLRFSAQQDESKQLTSRLEAAEKRARELEVQIHEVITAMAKRDETLANSASRLEEKTRENAALTRQLEQALGEARHHAELSREKTTAREHQLQARASELETHLAQARTEATRLRREKEELDQRLNARILDLKDRLDQSSSTNRSMQHYVQFLKQSYTSVFSTPSRMDTMTATSGFGDPSLSYDAPTIVVPTPTTQLFSSRPDLSPTGQFSEGLLQTP